MRAFDFDGTLYDGDASIDFFFFCLRTYPQCIRVVPRLLISSFQFLLKQITLDEYKSVFFSFLKYLDNPKQSTHAFWERNSKKLKLSVTQRVSAGDLIISASPAFLLQEPAKSLNAQLIATEVDIQTGQLKSKNCKGIEKINRCNLLGIKLPFDDAYSDSYSDTPLFNAANRQYLVKNNQIKRIDRSNFHDQSKEESTRGEEGTLNNSVRKQINSFSSLSLFKKMLSPSAIFILCFFLYFLTGQGLIDADSPNATPLLVDNFFWGSDSHRVFQDLTEFISENGHYRIKVHPLFLLLLQPLVFFISGITGSSALAVLFIQSLAAAGIAACFISVLKLFNVRSALQAGGTVCLMSCFPLLSFSVIPESFIFGGVGIMGMWCFTLHISKEKGILNKGEIAVLVFFGLINFGITLTNIISFFICLLYLYVIRIRKKGSHQLIVILILTLSIIVLFALIQSAVWSQTTPFWDSLITAMAGTSPYEETRYISLSFSQEKIWLWFKQAILFPLLPPDFFVATNGQGFHFLAWSKYDIATLIANMTFLGIIFSSLSILFIKKDRSQSCKIAIAFIFFDWLSHVILHFFYGFNESFMYSPQFIFLLLLAGTTSIDKMVQNYKGALIKALCCFLLLYIVFQVFNCVHFAMKLVEITASIANLHLYFVQMIFLACLATLSVVFLVAMIDRKIGRIPNEKRSWTYTCLRFIEVYFLIIFLVMGYQYGIHL